ncbi:hypothetical protein TRFO_40344 [Tritrichomonas foetus]|uniref:Uncharacterized protein n=1 Tax=Tritrichomonas foetus TaxID=1144522 RepID=A0A1J4J814_9EUKA|nr:hypothetical protein TRFO_40344 [Tritrichomonas foetus]|eukprot:OHS93364.1 hypothetical protein TRFO_40344 [Tritrichomonas foetus]
MINKKSKLPKLYIIYLSVNENQEYSENKYDLVFDSQYEEDNREYPQTFVEYICSSFGKDINDIVITIPESGDQHKVIEERQYYSELKIDKFAILHIFDFSDVSESQYKPNFIKLVELYDPIESYHNLRKAQGDFDRALKIFIPENMDMNDYDSLEGKYKQQKQQNPKLSRLEWLRENKIVHQSQFNDAIRKFLGKANPYDKEYEGRIILCYQEKLNDVEKSELKKLTKFAAQLGSKNPEEDATRSYVSCKKNREKTEEILKIILSDISTCLSLNC